LYLCQTDGRLSAAAQTCPEEELRPGTNHKKSGHPPSEGYAQQRAISYSRIRGSNSGRTKIFARCRKLPNIPCVQAGADIGGTAATHAPAQLDKGG